MRRVSMAICSRVSEMEVWQATFWLMRSLYICDGCVNSYSPETSLLSPPLSPIMGNTALVFT